MILKRKFTFILILTTICAVQSQKYLECKFDEGAIPCRLEPVGTASELQIISSILIDDPSMDPLMPLSDVTSTITPTLGNNLPCQLPYKLDGGSKDIYFCSRVNGSSNSSSCSTVDTTKQECVPGQYVMSLLAPGENLTYFVEVTGTTASSCLSFYYYITRPNVGQIVVWFTDIVGSVVQQIGQASNVPYNGWHQAQFSFRSNVNNYHVHFDLQRSENSDGLVFIALDEIKITDGRCEADMNETTTQTDQTTQTNAQQTSTTTATTIAILTTEATEMSSAPLATSSISSTTTTIPLSSSSWYDSTVPTFTTTITTTPSATTERPFGPVFECDFTGPCFGVGVLSITSGMEFSLPSVLTTSEPPRAPTSDATSITHPTSNNQSCSVPYKPQLMDGNSTTAAMWDMWFCYNTECPTPNGQTATCASDSYGLISLDPSETSKTIIDSLTPNVNVRDAAGDQCLRFYYYFTVYDGQDWGQQIRLSIRPNNQTVNQRSIGNLTVDDMKENKWQFHDVTFNPAGSAYTLQMDFVVANENRSDDSVTNRTINFALDMMELYAYNCSYVRDQLSPMTTAAPTVTTTTTTTSRDPGVTPPPEKDKSNLGLILGLSLGIGGFVVIIAIALLIYKFKVKGKLRRKDAYEYDKYFPLESPLHKRNHN